MRRCAIVCTVLLSLLAGAQVAAGQTIEKARSARSISLGHYDFQVPLSYVDARGTPIGYQVDICHAIVDRLKAQAGMPALDVRYVQMTNASATSLLANGTVDLACVGVANTVERVPYVSFTTTTFLSRFSFVSLKQNGYQSISDLKGKSIAFTTGTLASRRVTDIVLKEKLGSKLIPTKSPSEAFKLVETRQAEAYVATETILSSLIARSKQREDYAVSKTPLWMAPFGIMIRKNDLELKQLADGAIAELFTSGRIKEIYRKWLESPIPPDNIVLNIPMRPEFIKLISHPTDSPRVADYE